MDREEGKINLKKCVPLSFKLAGLLKINKKIFKVHQDEESSWKIWLGQILRRK